jgi:hypothetical protein
MLTPDQKFLVICGLLLAFAVFVGGLFALLRQQFNQMQRAMGVEVIPLWEAAWAAAEALLHHEEEKETDELMAEARQELLTRIPMNPERFARLEVLLFERIGSKNPSMRLGESEAAAAYPFFRKLALKTSGAHGLLSEVQLTGVRKSAEQVKDEKTTPN